MQLSIAKGIYRNKLPNIVIDQVYFESMEEDDINRVSLSLLYQIPADWTSVSPYRVMLIMTFDDSVIHGFRQHPSTAKHAIRDDSGQTHAYRKMYLMGDDSGEVSNFDEAVSLGNNSGEALIQRRVNVDIPDLPRDLWPNMYVYAIAYRVNPQDETPSGISQMLSTIRTGFPLSEAIYIRNRTPARAFVYRLESTAPSYGNKGDLWSGPTHRQGGRLMAGESHGDAPHPYLSITVVSNQKTQDKSFTREQSELFLGITRTSRELNQRMLEDMEVVQNLSGPPSNGISDIHFTRNTSGVLKAVFSINYKHLVQANTKMNFLFRNKIALNGCFEVENLRLFRTRTRSSVAPNRLTPGVLNTCGPGEQGTPKLVATLTDGNISGIGYQNQAVGVTTYVGTDIEMAGIEGGSYEYTLYVDGVDNSASAANHVLGILKTSLTAYDGWISQNFYGQHGALNTDASNRIRSQSQFLQEDTSWPNLIDTYLAAVMFIFGSDAFQDYSMVTWRKNLLAMCNPRNGDLESMYEVSELVRNFYTLLDKAVNPPTIGANNNTFSVQSGISTTSAAAKRISLLNVFPSLYDHRFDPATGFDFLDDELVHNSPTLTGFSYTNYSVRMNNEIGKYNISPEGTNPSGYLTPARIRTPTNIINTTTMAIGLNNTIDLFAALARPQTPKLSFHTSTPANSPSGASIDELLSMGGLTVQPLVLDIQSIRDFPTPTAAQAAALSLVSSADYLSSGSAFVQDDASQLAATSGSTEQNILYSHEEANDPTVSIRHSGLVMTMINSQLGGFSQLPPEHYTNGIAGSLAAKALSNNPLLLLENNTATIAISFNSIKEVQYFQGFETNSRGDALIGAPIWRILTEDMYNQANSQGTRLLCRTQDTPDVTSGGNILELGEYDNLFILGDASSAAITRIFMPYDFYYTTIVQNLDSAATQAAVNINTPLSNVRPFLIRLPLQ